MAPVKKDLDGLTRKDRAAANRRRMVHAALDLFGEHGFSATTMEAIAERAGVAVQTLYFTFHTKAELLQQAYALAVLGDGEPVPPHLTPWHRAAEAEPDVGRAIDHVAQGGSAILRRASALNVAVRAEPESREIAAHHEQLRVDGYRDMVTMLSTKHPRRTGLTVAKATDLFLVLMGPDVYLTLTRDRGWTHAQFVRWLREALGRELFALE